MTNIILYERIIIKMYIIISLHIEIAEKIRYNAIKVKCIVF